MMLWHLYLIASAQTTIEFYENKFYSQEYKLKGEVYMNIYDVGTIRNIKNFFNIGEK